VANFIVSYDLNGSTPTHKEVDDLLESLGATRGRILETVWYVGWNGSCEALCNSLNSILSPNDQLIVVEGKEVWWRNLLITDDGLQESWTANL
jgi:hypothetical protein